MAPLPIFYSFRRCPYAMRARLAIAASGLRCELREVVLRDKPAAMLKASPKGTIPVLVLAAATPALAPRLIDPARSPQLQPQQVIDESLDIMRWALSQSDPQSWLRPEREGLDAMLALIAQCDGQFKRHLDCYKYPQRFLGPATPAQHMTNPLTREENVANQAETVKSTTGPVQAPESTAGQAGATDRTAAPSQADNNNARSPLVAEGGKRPPSSGEIAAFSAHHRDAGLVWLTKLEGRLDGGYLFGRRPALADMAILPFVRQYAHVDDNWFAAQAPARVRQWLHDWEDGPLFAAVMPKFVPWRDGEAGVIFP